MLCDINELRAKNISYEKKQILYYVVLYCWERLKKNISKSNQNIKLSTFFCGFWGIKDTFYQISEATFQH